MANGVDRVSPDARCSTHPERSAELVCARCGDFACADCRGYTHCGSCVDGEDEAGFRPVPRSRWRNIHLGPGILFAIGALLTAWQMLMWSPRGIRFPWEAIGGAAALVLAALWFFVVRHRVGGSVSRAVRSEQQLKRLEADLAAGKSVPAEHLEALAPNLRSAPKAHAKLLLALAKSQRARGNRADALALTRIVEDSGWRVTEAQELRAALAAS